MVFQASKELRDHDPDRLELVLTRRRQPLAQLIQLLLRLSYLCSHLLDHDWQVIPEMSHQDSSNAGSEGFAAEIAGRQLGVDEVTIEIFPFSRHCLFEGHLILNVLPRSILDPNIAQTKTDLSVHDGASYIFPSVQFVDHSDNAYSSNTLRVRAPR